jgi:heme exporter protein CcmD
MADDTDSSAGDVMNPWPFILGAYGVTLLVLVIEILAVRARHRSARAAAASMRGTRRATSQ